MLAFLVFVAFMATLIFVGPWWPYSRGWGYRPATAVLALLAVWALVLWADLVALTRL
ncbi:DUF3309 family protein [Desertibaculum subflavum]|uniref:DUF3309 family protein n=1 Tax=Desertibaculum subflavum TaxID=2268458 RepID=UPI000E66DE98